MNIKIIQNYEVGDLQNEEQKFLAKHEWEMSIIKYMKYFISWWINKILFEEKLMQKIMLKSDEDEECSQKSNETYNNLTKVIQKVFFKTSKSLKMHMTAFLDFLDSRLLEVRNFFSLETFLKIHYTNYTLNLFQGTEHNRFTLRDG